VAENFVLVHGAWHGGWCWASVINELDKRGDRAFALDLPGSNGNPLDRAKVNLQVYIDSVIRWIEDRNLRNVILAGHSMGGLVLPGVAAKIPKRIKRVVFVTAMVAEDGKSGLDPESDATKALIQLAESRYDKSLPIEAMEENFRKFFFQDASRELQNWVLSALCPQPLRPMIDPVPMKAFHASGVPQSYLVCEDDLAPGGSGHFHDPYLPRLNNASIRRVKSGHEVMFTQPRACADALYEFARE
jgi:pimeloyl-ACP methyl ester carboxylesterase